MAIKNLVSNLLANTKLINALREGDKKFYDGELLRLSVNTNGRGSVRDIKVQGVIHSVGT